MQIADVWPLTPLQQGLLFHASTAQGDGDDLYAVQLAIGLTGDGGLSLIDDVPLGVCARVNFCELHSFFRTYFGLWRSSISENQPSLGGLLAPFVAAGVTEGSITFVGGTPVIRLLLGASGSPPGAGSARVAARSPSL